MVEVFKTNVTNIHQARTIVAVIENQFDGYKVNFDLDDCDRILRVEASRGSFEADPLIGLLNTLGVRAEVLA